jgi:hypothetical protein
MRVTASLFTLLLLGACGQQQPENNANNRLLIPDGSNPPRTAPAPPAPHPPAPVIDPKSKEAAQELVKGFARLLDQREFEGAYMLLGPGAPPRADFEHQFARYRDLEVSVGDPGDQEGAAGSIYVSVPLTVSGVLNGRHVSNSATAVVRRVNDVPGSTEAQRRWHIERIEWGTAR